MPISTASAPASTTARTTSHHSRPSPPVTYGTSSLRPVGALLAQVRLERDVHRDASRHLAERLGDLRRVLVAPARERDEHRRARRAPTCPASRASQPIACAGSSAGTMPSVAASSWKPVERLVVGRGVVLGAALRREHRVLGTDARDSRGRR